MTPNLATLDRADVNLMMADQLATLRQGLPVYESVSPRGQVAVVVQRGKRRVVGILEIYLAFRRLSEVAVGVDRLVTDPVGRC